MYLTTARFIQSSCGSLMSFPHFPSLTVLFMGFWYFVYGVGFWWGKDWDYAYCLNKKLFDFRVCFYKIIYQINVHYEIISSNYFSEKNVSGEIIAKVLTDTIIQHYLSWFHLLILYTCHKKITTAFWVIAEKALEETVGSQQKARNWKRQHIMQSKR